MKPIIEPRMDEVAHAVGLHRSTVSLALRNHPSIPESTRAKVREAAERLGYRLNPLVSALMSFRRSAKGQSRHTTLAFVTSSRPAKAWRESRTLRDQLAGAEEQARLQGYRIEEFPFYAPGMTPARFNQVLWSRGIVGLIVCPLRNGLDTLPLDWSKFAAVGIAFSQKQPSIPRVGSDHGNSMRLAVRECRARGYKRIGLALPEQLIERVEEQWLASYLVEHAYPRVSRRPAPLIAGRWSKENFAAWFRREKPDVVITGGDPDSVIGWLRQLGPRVPEEVGVVSLDLHVRDGSVAGINQYSEDVGAAVVDYLIGMLHRNERGPSSHAVRVHMMGDWVEGATVRPRPDPA